MLLQLEFCHCSKRQCFGGPRGEAWEKALYMGKVWKKEVKPYFNYQKVPKGMPGHQEEHAFYLYFLFTFFYFFDLQVSFISFYFIFVRSDK